MKPFEINNYLTDLESFSEGNSQMQKWMKGVTLGDSKDKATEYTFYFLGKQVELPRPLRKDGSTKKGRGKNWIAGMIPKNRCVTFAEIVRRLKASEES